MTRAMQSLCGPLATDGLCGAAIHVALTFHFAIALPAVMLAVQYFIYQILRGLKYIHSAHVLHRSDSATTNRSPTGAQRPGNETDVSLLHCCHYAS